MTDLSNYRDELIIRELEEENKKLKEGIKEFLAHSMEFTTNSIVSDYGEPLRQDTFCPACYASQPRNSSKVLVHKDSCPMTKLKELVE